MAKVWYLDGIAGSDSNNGTSRALAKATLDGARLAAEGDGNNVWSIILVRPHTYLGYAGAASFGGSSGKTIVMPDQFYPGNVIFDYQELPRYITNPDCYIVITASNLVLFGVHFRNMNATVAAVGVDQTMGSPYSGVHHCVFYSQNGSPTGIGVRGEGSNMQGRVVNNTFYNLTDAVTNYRQTFTDDGRLRVEGNYANTVSLFRTAGGFGYDYNAYSGNTETNGIDTAVTNPGFRSISGLDWRLDPDTIPADYTTFMTSGRDGGRIAAMGVPGYYYNAEYAPLEFFSPDPTPAQGNPQPSWENEGPNGTATYTDGTPGDIIEDPNKELVVDLTTTPTATGGRVRSPVFAVGADGLSSLTGAVFSALEPALTAAPGGAIDIDTTNPRVIEYRSSASVFLIGDGSPAWSSYTSGTNLNSSHRYVQFRVEFQTEHTNA